MNATDMVTGFGRILRALAHRDRSGVPAQFAAVPGREIRTLLYRLARSQRPGHSPAGEQTPPFADEWLAAYDAGRDVVRWYDAEPVARARATGDFRELIGMRRSAESPLPQGAVLERPTFA
jgi:hypothetical protein